MSTIQETLDTKSKQIIEGIHKLKEFKSVSDVLDDGASASTPYNITDTIYTLHLLTKANQSYTDTLSSITFDSLLENPPKINGKSVSKLFDKPDTDLMGPIT